MNREAIRRAVRERVPRQLANSLKRMGGFPRYSQPLQLRDSQSP